MATKCIWYAQGIVQEVFIKKGGIYFVHKQSDRTVLCVLYAKKPLGFMSLAMCKYRIWGKLWFKSMLGKTLFIFHCLCLYEVALAVRSDHCGASNRGRCR